MECDRVNRNRIKNKSLDTSREMPGEWPLKAKFLKLSSRHIPSLNNSLLCSGLLQTLHSSKHTFALFTAIQQGASTRSLCTKSFFSKKKNYPPRKEEYHDLYKLYIIYFNFACFIQQFCINLFLPVSLYHKD